MAKKKNIKKGSNAMNTIDERFEYVNNNLFDKDLLKNGIKEMLEEDAGMVDNESAMKTMDRIAN